MQAKGRGSVMAAVMEQRSHVSFRGPLSVPIQKTQDFMHLASGQDPLQHANQLQFNMDIPYSINSLGSHFRKPQPMVIEKVPVVVTDVPVVPDLHRQSLPSSPASSISSDRLHFAVHLAKMDAKRLKQRKEMEHYEQAVNGTKEIVAQNNKTKKTTRAQGVRNAAEDSEKPDKTPSQKLQNKKQKQKEVRRNLHEHHFYPVSDRDPEETNTTSEDKQAREIRRLEEQIHKYLERLDELIHQGQEVVQKKDRRFRRAHKDDVSHLSDEDADPRQFERAEEQATRSARVLYMIERQIRELDDELRRKGRNMRPPKKSQTLNRLAAAQRATVRALQMLISSAPLQPKRSRHYPAIFQELSSLIQQLSLLQMQLESGVGPVAEPRLQNKRFDNVFHQTYDGAKPGQQETEFKSPRKTAGSRTAFALQPDEKSRGQRMRGQPAVQNTSSPFKEMPPDDSVLTVEPTPERSATLKAGLQALLRARKHEQKPAVFASAPMNVKKNKAVILPSSLQRKRRKAQHAVLKSTKQPDEDAHFTKETTASRLKKVDRHKLSAKDETKEDERSREAENVPNAAKPVATSPAAAPADVSALSKELQKREIQRQVWLEDESRQKLREAMEIPKTLVCEAEEAIRRKLKPLLDQAQSVVDSSKMKPVQERFADLASSVTMKQSETLSEMILDDLLEDTAEEFQRLERDGDLDTQSNYVQNSSTLENILQRLEEFEKEEDSIRRRLQHISYADPGGRKPGVGFNKLEQRKSCSIAADEDDPCVGVENREKLERFTKDEMKTSSAQDYSRPSASYTSSPLTRSLEEAPVPIFLPPKIRENIFSYRERYSRYLQRTSTEHNSRFDPWKVIERLSDEIFDDMFDEVANEVGGACDDVTELIFTSEFLKE